MMSLPVMDTTPLTVQPRSPTPRTAPPPDSTPFPGEQASSAHPTGILSCLELKFNLCCKW